MTSVSMKVTIEVPAETIWSIIRDFNGIARYVAAVASCSTEGMGVGAVRTLTLQDGGKILERLESFDDQSRELTYSILQSPLPVERYMSMMRVRPSGENQCEVVWSSTFKPKGTSKREAENIIKSIYSMGFEGLSRLQE